MIRLLLRLTMLVLFGWFVGVPIALGVVSDNNRQECWKIHGAGNLGCKGDGTFVPPPRTLN